MKFSKINNRSRRLNEGKGKFEIERDYDDEGIDFVHTEKEWSSPDYKTKVYFSAFLERGNEIDALGGHSVYCSIEGYDKDTGEFADEVIKRIYSLGGYTKIVNYLKSL